MNGYGAAAARLRLAIQDVEQVVERVEELREKAHRSADDGYLDGVALNLHGFYAGVERIFEDIARTTGEGLPDGHDWHQRLLLQMSAEIEGVRPRVVSRETRHCLDEYRGFRHVVRNVYAFQLRSARLQELAQELPACYQAVRSELLAFASHLEQVKE